MNVNDYLFGFVCGIAFCGLVQITVDTFWRSRVAQKR
jgi:hypothetical protein